MFFTLITVCGILGVLALAGWVVGQYFGNKHKLSKQEQRELSLLRTFFDDADQLAIENRDIDPTAMRLDLMIGSYRKHIRELR